MLCIFMWKVNSKIRSFCFCCSCPFFSFFFFFFFFESWPSANINNVSVENSDSVEKKHTTADYFSIDLTCCSLWLIMSHSYFAESTICTRETWYILSDKTVILIIIWFTKFGIEYTYVSKTLFFYLTFQIEIM